MTRPLIRLAPAALAALALAGCTTPSADTLTENGPVAANLSCNPIAAEWGDCLYPYPSNVFSKPDAALPGKMRVEIPEKAQPPHPSAQGIEGVDFFEMFPADGFSVAPQIAVRIPGGFDTKQLVFHTGDLGASLKAESPTLLLDAETGEPQLHFAEIDPRPDLPDDRALVIRPLKRLKDGHRYVVALHGLKRADGSLIPAPATFQRVRDDDADTDLEERFAGYYNGKIFPTVEKFGVKRADLQLAWDFTTQSEQHVTGDMLEMRRLTLAALEQTPPELKNLKVDDAPDEHGDQIGREVKGLMLVPNFLELESGVAPLGARLHRGADGKVALNGTIAVPFTVRVPKSVLAGTKQGRMVQYGHGFFGSHTELKSGYPSRFAQATGSILIGTDWMGMATLDGGLLGGDLVTQPSQAMRFTDRTHQGMMNFIALNYVARRSLPQTDALKKDGKLLYEAERLYYYGISQGCILGSVYLALSPAIEQAACSVGGASFGFMMSRASPFNTFLGFVEQGVGGKSEDPALRDKAKANALKIEQLMQSAMDRIDPVTYLPHLTKDFYLGAPQKRTVLFQTGVSDAAVPDLAAHLWVRSTGVPALAPWPRAIYGIEQQQGPIDGSAWAEFDFHLPNPAVDAIPAQTDNEVHEGVRRLDAAIKQIDALFRPDGKIQNYCEGPCDPE